MKISKLFHWLYASLMLLPFASVVSTTLYYSFNKNAVIPSVSEEVSKEADFNQLILNGDFDNTDNWYLFEANATSYSASSQQLSVNIIDDSYSYWQYGFYQINSYLNLDDIYLIKVTLDSSSFNSYRVEILGGNPTSLVNGDNDILVTPNVTFSTQIAIYPIGNYDIGTSYAVKNFQIFNLSKMFGSGNEPSIQEFNTWFTDDYYDFVLSEHIVIPNFDTIQVADNSINHFWLPSFGAIGYNIQSYIGWVIGGIFGLNVVNGIGFVIVRLFTYWLIISICWLIFDVLMYVPNLVHKWLDKAAID